MVLKGRSAVGDKEDAEEGRAEMMKVMAVLCHPRTSAANKKDRGRCHFIGHGTGKIKDPVRLLKPGRPSSYISKFPVPDATPENLP